MVSTTSSTYSYEDRRLGDTSAVTVATDPDVFQPTSTTVLLLRAARATLGRAPRSALDLGCGTGIVAIVLARLLPADAVVCASDVSPAAVDLTRRNADRNGVRVDCRCGSMFAPWTGARFDLIVDDVSGVAEPLARGSGWYPPAVPSEAGLDGTRWTMEMLSHARDHLAPGGVVVFPVLTLSREDRVLECARASFAVLEQVQEQWYPLNEALVARLPLVEQLAARGDIRVEKRGSRWCWATRIFVAS